MKRSRFTEEQIIGVEQEAGSATADVCRKHRFASPAAMAFGQP